MTKNRFIQKATCTRIRENAIITKTSSWPWNDLSYAMFY